MPEKMKILRDMTLILHEKNSNEDIISSYFKLWCLWSKDDDKYKYELKKYNTKLNYILEDQFFIIKEILQLFEIKPFTSIENVSVEELNTILVMIKKLKSIGAFDEIIMDSLRQICKKIDIINGWNISKSDYNELLDDLKYLFDGEILDLKELNDLDSSLQSFIENNKAPYETCNILLENINCIIDDVRKRVYNDDNKMTGFDDHFGPKSNIRKKIKEAFEKLDQHKLEALESEIGQEIKKY
ncbi:MAG TPA: hypothetical protein VFC41_03580 [Anaerovoracaceae bacterium]|nr:hypothetical protein [Anaerovoracaceae bacterium]